ncbi:MAG: helix-turn-helix transcriptional regulator [Gammaproteobacteria bacterium]
MKRVENEEVRRALSNALARGSLALPDACRAIRALEGLSQAALAARLGVDVKVIKGLEAGQGNPRLSSLERLADAFGLKVALVRPSAEVGLLDPAQRAADEYAYRVADAEAVESGRMSVRERDADNAMVIGPSSYELPELK